VAEGSGRSKDYIATVGRGMQPTHVRQTNQRAVLSVISLEPGVTNAELSRLTGLAPQTVSAVLTDLEDAQLITRGDVRRGQRGQPATPVYMNPTGAFAIGAEIGWNHIEVCLVAIGAVTAYRYRRDYAYPDASTVFEELAGAVAEVTSGMSAAERSRLIGLGLAAPGGIGDTSSLIEVPAGQTALWADIDIARAAAPVTGLDGTLINDGNAACWAERVAFPIPRPVSFAFLLIDTFVAAGIVAENRLWEGVTGASANLGSMLVAERQGGSRFVHEIASLHALQHRFDASGFDMSEIYGDSPRPAAQKILDVWIEDASYALAQTALNTATVLEYDVAIIEAVLPRAITDRIVEAVRRHVASFPSLGRNSPKVIAGHLGRSGAAEGAALLCMYRRFFSRDIAHMDG
jgi:predicted NBD/HSP70 family sugar kinase